MHKILPENRSTEAMVLVIALLSRSNQKDHIHRGDPLEEFPTVFLSS